MFLTRLGFGSKIVITGDVTQIDLPDGKPSGLREAMRVLQKVEGIGICELTNADVVRHVMVQRIVKAYERIRNCQKRRKGEEMMAKRHYIPITADVPGGASEGQRRLYPQGHPHRPGGRGGGFSLRGGRAADQRRGHPSDQSGYAGGGPSPRMCSAFPEFDLQPGELPGGEDADPGTGLVPLGDMVISMEHVAAQAKEYGHSNRRELAYLVVHSVLHLLGYDHLDEGPAEKARCGQERKLYWQNWGSPGRTDMGKFALYTIGFALLACVPAILLAGMFSGGGGDVAPFLLGMLAVGAVLAGAVCLKDKLDRMEETLKAVSKTLQEVKTELETVKGRQEVAEIKLDTVAAKLGISRED